MGVGEVRHTGRAEGQERRPRVQQTPFVGPPPGPGLGPSRPRVRAKAGVPWLRRERR